jgi:hypothetical protein
VLQAVLQEEPSTKSYILHALGKGHETEYKGFTISTFHSGGFAASYAHNNCDLFSSLQLWALTQKLTPAPVQKMMMPSVRTELG